ncbi:MAG: glycosyltransferase family 4 protein [Anaerolineales bacterium]
MRKKIAFIRAETWPYANTRMVEVLQDEFPEYEIIILDVYDTVKKQPLVLIRNILEVIRIYGLEIIAHKKRARRVFWRTPYIFQQIKKLVQKTFSNESIAFSFQMQSIFDGSMTGIPHFVYTDHTHLANLSYPNFSTSHLYSRYWINLEKMIYDNASMVFVRSSNIINSLVKDYSCPATKIVCAYAGSNAVHHEPQIDLDRYKKKNILFVGIDWERKGGPDLIQAFKLTLQTHPDATLTIVGCSPLIDSPNCHVIGRIPVDAVNQYYREASIFCLPTHLEPFGIAFIEAMASKLPIVATNVGAIPDFVNDGVTGFLVPPGNEKSIANALTALLSDPKKMQEFGEKGYELARSRYTWLAVGKLMKSHINNVLEKISYPAEAAPNSQEETEQIIVRYPFLRLKLFLEKKFENIYHLVFKTGLDRDK